jgi:hypothetical protein
MAWGKLDTKAGRVRSGGITVFRFSVRIVL